jgi:hypothetical protein
MGPEGMMVQRQYGFTVSNDAVLDLEITVGASCQDVEAKGRGFKRAVSVKKIRLV